MRWRWERIDRRVRDQTDDDDLAEPSERNLSDLTRITELGGLLLGGGAALSVNNRVDALKMRDNALCRLDKCDEGKNDLKEAARLRPEAVKTPSSEGDSP